MYDGSITFSTALDNVQLEKDLAGLTKKIEKQEQKIADVSSRRDKAKVKGLFERETLDAEKKKLQEIKNHLADIRAMSKDKSVDPGTRASLKEQIPLVQQERNEQQQRVNMLQAEWNKTENSVDRYSEELKEAEHQLDEQKTEAGILTLQIEGAKSAQNGFAAAADAAENAMNRLINRVKGLATRVFVFTMITKALRAVRDLTMKYIKTNDEARQAIAQLKGALYTLAQPLIEVIIPAFTLLVQILAKVVTAIAQFVSMLFGKSLKQSRAGAKSMYEEANAIGAVGSAADEAAGSLAGFDEINTISTESGGGGGGIPAEIAPDFSGVISDASASLLASLGLLVIGAILTFTGANVLLGIGMMALGAYGVYKEVTENPEAVKTALAGWMGGVLVVTGIIALAIGTILAFSGVKIPLGISLIVLGAASLYGEATLAPDKLSEMLNGWLGEVLVIAGFIALSIGVLLAFSGVNIPLGIGLILLGAASISGEAALAPDKMREMLNGWLGEVIALVGVSALVIGVVLAFSGVSIPLGIGLILLGVTLLATEAALAPNKMKEMLNGWLGDMLALVGVAALVIGVVLAFSGINIPLGVGLIVLGAGALIAESVLAPGKMKEMLNGWLGAAIVIAGIVAVVIGIILICTGVGLPLGIALLVLGVGGLISGVVANWNFILDKLKSIWAGIKSWWNSNVKKFLTLEYWKDKGKGIIDGFLSGLKKAWEAVSSWARSVVNWFTGLFGGAKNSVNELKSNDPRSSTGGGRMAAAPEISSYRIPSIPEAKIPRLAQGAVIPPNREFMAVLGDQRSGYNIEAPEDLIRKIVREESGGGDYTALLQAILDAIKAGKVMMVDKRILARIATEGINDMTRQAGKPVLLI